MWFLSSADCADCRRSFFKKKERHCFINHLRFSASSADKYVEIMRQVLRISASIVVLAGVFFLGFLCGLSRQRPENISSAPVSIVLVEPKDDELSEKERQMAEALNDPDFRRVHDHLMRDRPVQMNAPALPGSVSEKSVVPMSQRPPVRFDLDSIDGKQE